MPTTWTKFDKNNIPPSDVQYLITDGFVTEISRWPSEDWGLFYGGIRKVKDVTHYSIITLPCKHLIIENLMGGVAWIHFECESEIDANLFYKEMAAHAPHSRYQLMTISISALEECINTGVMQYLEDTIKM
jgi:hypothetical protein